MKRIRQFESIAEFDVTTDVVVCGYGGAGGCAALEARRGGSEVILLERSSAGGGSTELSACELYLGGSGGTRLQRDLGFEDSTENFYNYLKACFGNNCDDARLRMYAEGAAEHFDWIEALGVPYKRGFYAEREVVALTGDSLQFTGNEKAWPFTEASVPIPRGHLPADSGHDGGKTLVAALKRQVEAAGVDIRCDARVTALVQDAAGRVRGVIARVDNRDVAVRARQGVVLCMGGFIMNEEMTRRHLPDLDGCITRHGNPGDMGDGILMGVEAGGNAINMGEAFISIAHYPPAQLTYGIFVNEHGQRFINEDVYLARLGHYIAVQPTENVFMFIDNKHFDRPAYLEPEIVSVGESVAEVEQEAGLPEGALQQTVAYYNEHAEKGEDPTFHKAAAWLEPFETPPFALIRYRLRDLRPPTFTLGGLETLPTGEVLTVDGDIVEGLYAAGRTAAGIPRTSRGYASGMSVGDATFFGRRAGRQVAARARLEE